MTNRRRMLPAILFVVALAAQASTLGPISCATCGNGFDASAFNVVTLGTSSTLSTGNFSPTSDIGGRVAVFGNYTGSGYQIDSQATSVPNPYTETYALIVNGNISTNPFVVGSGSGSQSVWVGGTHPSFNAPLPTVSQSPATLDFDFVAARTSLDNLSTSTLANYAGAVTGTPVSNGTNYVLTAVGSGLLVYNVPYTYFTDQNLAFEVDVAATGQSVVVNITGAPATFSFTKGTIVKYGGVQVTANTTGGVPVLFNLPEVTSLDTANGPLNGSFLAPYAVFNSPNQTVDGQLFVASVNGLAETHDQYYNGIMPPLMTTPEPGSSALMLGALLVAGGVISKRRYLHPASNQEGRYER